MNCSICESSESRRVYELDSGNFDQSVFYRQIRVYTCERCGHIFNELNEIERRNFSTYYLGEYAQFHKFANVTLESDVLEISQKDLRRYLETLTIFNDTKRLCLDRMYRKIVLDQFIEHVFEPRVLFEELSKSLAIDGILRIDCPNAMLYDTQRAHFDNYYFLIREHIQHFDATNLVRLANEYGFEALETRLNKYEIIRDVFMPNLSITFRNTGVQRRASFKKTELEQNILKSFTKYPHVFNCEVYCYGIGREFLYLFANNYLPKVVGLIDNTSTKQEYTVNKMKIVPDEVLKSLSSNSTILITAFAHRKLITKKLRDLGFKGTIL